MIWQERFSGLPPSGGHVKWLTEAGIVTAGMKSLFGETWGFRNMAVFCVLWVGKSFYPFTHSWKWHSLFWKGREQGA